MTVRSDWQLDDRRVQLKHDVYEFKTESRAVHAWKPDTPYCRWAKPAFDIAGSIVLLPAVMVAAVVLLVLNRFFNRGPVFYIQSRMGHGCRAFGAVKFCTMQPAERVTRRADDPLEHDRIRPLGQFLRRSRIDELPLVINVLRGEMSLIGPRPDYFHHAPSYLRLIPDYRHRQRVRPGISGLAQTDLGYVESTDDTRRKVALDLRYVEDMGLRLDLYVFWRTLQTVFGAKGC